jgi:type IV pilus assembly protein PilV
MSSRAFKKPLAATSTMTGFTMIEVLVTLIILAVGLLGIAALQIVGLRGTGGSENRTQATIFADDIAERMRSNISAVDTNQFSAVNLNAASCAAPPPVICSDNNAGGVQVAAAVCSSTQLATYDLTEWFCGVSSGGAFRGGVLNTLPSATANIACNDANVADADVCTAHSTHTITLNWTERNPDQSTGAAATVNQSMSMTIQP